MLYQMLRTKFSSIQGSSSPILRVSAGHSYAIDVAHGPQAILRRCAYSMTWDSPEGRFAGSRLTVGASRAAGRAHVALGREAVAGGVHLLAEIRLRAGLAGLLARGLALELVVVLEAHGYRRPGGVMTD